MIVEVGDPGVQLQKRLRAFPPSKRLPTSLLSPCGALFVLNDVVAARREDHLLMVDINQARNVPDRGTIPPQLIGVHDL